MADWYVSILAWRFVPLFYSLVQIILFFIDFIKKYVFNKQSQNSLMHKTTIKWEIHNPELDSSRPSKPNLQLYKPLLTNYKERD